MNQDIFNLRLFIDHESAIQSDSSITEGINYFNKNKHHYAAVLNGSKVMGLTSPQALALQRDASNKASNYCLIPHPTICCTRVSTEENINYALGRSDDKLLEDIILVDESMDFIGLINAKTFIRIQKRYYSHKRKQSKSQLDEQTETINNLQNDLKITVGKLEENQQMIVKMQAMRTAFIARFSHEARTSMTSIQGMLDLLKGTQMADDQKQMIHTANTSTHTLLRLIQSTQDFAHIETDSIQLSEKTFSPIKTLHECLRATKAEATEKGLTLELEHHEIPEYIIGDEQRFQQVIENLIGKSIDQTTKGGVHILATEIQHGTRLILKVEIKDTSSGLETCTTDQLFYTSSRRSTASISDIGSLVSERLIHKLGGTLNCSYEEGQGNRFVIELPMNVLSPLAKTMADGTSTQIFVPPTGERLLAEAKTALTVLIIDDNSINLDVARQFLTKLGCKVYLASSGKEGIETLRTHPIDCIFLDCRMPSLSGYDTAKLIRDGEAGKGKANVFISAMTAQISNKARQECFDAGMNYFIPKPVSKRSFENAIKASRNESDKPVSLFKKKIATG